MLTLLETSGLGSGPTSELPVVRRPTITEQKDSGGPLMTNHSRENPYYRQSQMPTGTQFDRHDEKPDDAKLKYDRFIHENIRSPLNFDK